MIMLPIPVPIIGSNKRLLIPLLYFTATASFCYLFLIAFVKVNPNQYYQKKDVIAFQKISQHHNFPFNRKPNLFDLRRKKTFDKFKREVDTDLFFDAYSDKRISSINTAPTFKSRKKKLDTFLTWSKSNTTTTKQNNGARRSNSTKIRVGHQDLDPYLDLAPSVQPWPHDPECSRFQTHFAKKGTFKPRALVSFPGSGNSWLRYLIECSTGIFSGSVFNDKKIASRGLLGELRSPNDGSTIVQKTHHDALRFSNFKSQQAYVKLTELMFGYRGILLIRNPYDALISYWNFVETRDHRGHASEGKFNTYKWHNFVLTMLPKWSSMIMSWVDNSQSLLIVQYEQVKKNAHQELIRILRYLEQPVDEDRLTCLLKVDNVEGPFHRRGHKNKTQNSFFTNNPFLSLGTRESETKEKEKNLLDLAQVPEQNSKSWRNDSLLEQNSSRLLSSLDLIVQDNINQINRFFSDKYIPIFLNYRGPTSCCSQS